eukprot:366517-Chlamydomonas_euryale.AAC.18
MQCNPVPETGSCGQWSPTLAVGRPLATMAVVRPMATGNKSQSEGAIARVALIFPTAADGVVTSAALACCCCVGAVSFTAFANSYPRSTYTQGRNSVAALSPESRARGGGRPAYDGPCCATPTVQYRLATSMASFTPVHGEGATCAASLLGSSETFRQELIDATSAAEFSRTRPVGGLLAHDAGAKLLPSLSPLTGAPAAEGALADSGARKCGAGRTPCDARRSAGEFVAAVLPD